MAWENVITGYQLWKFEIGDRVPNDAVFVCSHLIDSGHYGRDIIHIVFKVPIYRKQNIKKPNREQKVKVSDTTEAQ